ncbi:MAG: alpha/beta hydrolase [Lachnospiraceae bacterium]|nr:alpha/beta hydrolase [Lachnospiraceae bacterium]MCI1328330.1 alpha/beta hydrolase [Lachnospiraceae bacterium]
MKQLHVNHVDISYETVGQGRPVILIHGNGEDHTIFDRTAAILEKRFTCYLPDSRGHGRSRWIGEFHYREMAEDLIQFMEKLNLRNAAVVGFSDGGIIGLMAAARTDRISSLIACGANTRPEGLRGLYLLGMRILHFFGRSPLMRLMVREPDISDEGLAQIRADTLIVAGQHDLIRKSETDHIAGTIPGAEKIILSGETHGSYIVHSEKLAKIILKFLVRGRDGS